jgi:hypothetical protein
MHTTIENVDVEIVFDKAHHFTFGLTEGDEHTVKGRFNWIKGTVKIDYSTTDPEEIAKIKEYNTFRSSPSRQAELQAFFEQRLLDNWRYEIEQYVTMI